MAAASSSSIFFPVIQSDLTRSRRSQFLAATRPITLGIALPHLAAGGSHSPNRRLFAVESPGERNEEEDTDTDPAPDKREENPEAAEAAEKTARKILMSRQVEEGEKNLWSGVAEEVGEIEWPAFGKVLGTTGVVLAVIGGSSVALLSVNALLAELSDRVFAGRGVQDFFG